MARETMYLDKRGSMKISSLPKLIYEFNAIIKN